MPFWNRKKKNKNKKEPNFEGLNWQDNPIYEGKAETKANPMSGYLRDMENSKTRHHSSFARFFTKGDSKEYSDVKAALSDVVQYTSGSFSNDAKANSQMMNDAVKSYHRLMRACQVYLDKKGGESDSGRARKYKVGQIMALAMQDYESVKRLSYSIRNMSVEEQSGLNWQQILQEARTVALEVNSLTDYTAIGANMKTGEDAGRLLPGKGVFTREQKFKTEDMVKELFGTEDAGPKDNFISVAYNEGKEEDFASNIKSKTFHQSNRNVATSRMANLLGLGGIVEQSSTVKVKEKRTGNIVKGNLMTLAKGEAGASIANGEVYEKMKKKESIQDRIADAGALFAPTVQKELTSLQVLDYICGQTDRHANNFFLEKDEKTNQYTHVHGIDNDMSFGTGVDFGALVKKTGDHQRKSSLRMVVDAEGNLTIPHMDKQLAQNIINLSKEEVEFALEDLIEPEAIKAAVHRLEIVKNAIHKELSKTDSKVFLENESDWGETTHKDFIFSTGDMKQMQAGVKEKGNEGYYQSAEFVDGKDKRYQTFRQNTYYGEYMLAVMGYHMGNRKFERD